MKCNEFCQWAPFDIFKVSLTIRPRVNTKKGN